jgi:hypothetical protein
MTAARLVGVGVIYVFTAIAWFILGGSVVSRSGESDGRLSQEVAQLWGGRHVQHAPRAVVRRPRVVTEDVHEKDARGQAVTRRVDKTILEDVPAPLDRSRITVDLALAHRRKGLLWYDTYGVAFAGEYSFRNPDPEARRLRVEFVFPSATGIYDEFQFEVNGAPAPAVSDLSKGVHAELDLPPGGEAVVKVRYRSRGLDRWEYAMAPGVAQVRDFELNMRTDFAAIDFPPGTISPSEKAERAGGWDLAWRFASLVTGQRIGLDAPERLNPGPLAARITFFAPVGLLFFVTVMVILGVISGRSLHPMHYFFLAAAFFAFHLLLAYLVDHLDIHASFAIASAVSVFLVVSYLRIVAGTRFAVLRAGAAQLLFLVLFSYAFFFEGYTGLTVTIGAVLTLFVLMQVTARVDWATALSGLAPVAPNAGGRSTARG